jgi:pyruvate dehydrogenase E2 component (dihydrolipoamide acetyltransferase)
MADVIMPQMGESIFEGTITKWLKKPGDKVERDEPLFEISTDKVDAEIPAPTAGVLREIKVGEGKTVPIQTVVAVIDAAGASAEPAAPAQAPPAQPKGTPPAAQPGAGLPASAAPQPAPSQAKQPAPAPRLASVPPRPVSRPQGGPSQVEPAPPAGTSRQEVRSVPPPRQAPTPMPPAPGIVPAATRDAGPDDGEHIYSSPLVRRLAREHNIDLSAVRGTGAGGRISKKDVLAVIEAGGTAQAAGPERAKQPEPAPGARPLLESAVPRDRLYFGRYEVQPMSVMRQRIAEHMVTSKHVSPHVYSVDEADITRIAHIRASAKDEFEERHQTKLTFMPFFVRSCVDALRDFPSVNASLDGTNIVLHGEINIGIAVALDWGLIVPVLKNAEEKNFLGLQRNINDLAERARTKKLKPDEVQESTFSITNPGTFGGLMGFPVINQPNVAILGIGAIQKRPVVIDDAIAIRSMVYLTLSYDHRVVVGAVAHKFMGQIKKRLEGWNEEVL